MKPTCPPLRRLNQLGASDPKNRVAVAAESCLLTNSSAVEKVKSAESGAESDFSQDGYDCVIGRDKTRHARAESPPFPHSVPSEKHRKELTSGRAWPKIFGNWVDTFGTFGNVKLWEKTDLPTNTQTMCAETE